MWRRVVLIWLIGLLLGAIVFVYAVNRYVFLQTKDKAQNSITEIPIEEPPRMGLGETFAVLAAWFDVNALQPTPILGNKKLIEP
jgi:hypothetical protein